MQYIQKKFKKISFSIEKTKQRAYNDIEAIVNIG